MELVNRTADIIAVEINSIKEQTMKVVISNSIEIGRRLCEAKELVEHGQWGKWLEKKVDYSKTTANKLMKIFQEYGSQQLNLLGDNVKSKVYEKLTYSQAVELLGVPSEERETFIKENDVENMSTRELKKVIKELNDERKEKENIKKKLEEKEEELRKTQGYEEEIRRYKKIIEEREEEIKELEERPIEVTGITESTSKLIEELEKIKFEKEEAENKLKEFKNKIKEKNEKEIAKVEVYFKKFVDSFKELAVSLSELNNEEIKEKYSGATKKALNSFIERI